MAGLLSGFGPRRFGGCPSAIQVGLVRADIKFINHARAGMRHVPLVVLFSVKVLRKLRLSEDKGFLSWDAGDPPPKLD